MCYSAAGAAEREARADDERPRTDSLGNFLRLDERVGTTGLRHVEAELRHRGLEEVAVFRPRDGLGIRADHLDTALCEHAGLGKSCRNVECRLTAQGRQKGIWAFLADDGGDGIDRQRLDVGRFRHFRIGHYRCRIRVHKDNLVALFPERLHGLDTRVVEFAALANHDWPRADDQNPLQVGALHFTSFLSAPPQRGRGRAGAGRSGAT